MSFVIAILLPLESVFSKTLNVKYKQNLQMYYWGNEELNWMSHMTPLLFLQK